MANTNPFEVALDAARKALTEALEERSAVEQRIISLKQTIEGLSALCEPESNQDLVDVEEGGQRFSFSLTDAIRMAFSADSEAVLTPPQIRDALLANGLNLSRYKQPLVPIHNTLKRLASQEEIVESRDAKGDFLGYRWVSPLARAVAELSPTRSANCYADLMRKNPAFYEALPGSPGTPLPNAEDVAREDELRMIRKAVGRNNPATSRKK